MGVGEWVGLATAVVAIVAYLIRERDKYRELQRKVSIMWASQTRRGHIAARRSGMLIATPAHVPDRVPPRVRELFADIAPELQATYRREWRRLTDSDLMLEIEGRFGERIVHEVCEPLGISDLQCLSVAAIIAREDIDE